MDKEFAKNKKIKKKLSNEKHTENLKEKKATVRFNFPMDMQQPCIGDDFLSSEQMFSFVCPLGSSAEYLS